MSKKIWGLFFISLFVAITASTKIAGPPPYSTGAPGEKTCAQATCHDGVTDKINSGAGLCSIVFDNGNLTYDHSRSYNVTITATHPGLIKYGFQVVAITKGGNQPAGNVTITDSIRTQLRDKKTVSWGCCPTREWVEHTAAGITTGNPGSLSWTYGWTAPASGTADVVFYAATLAGNNDGKDTLDYTYTKTLTIAYKQQNTGVAEEKIGEKPQFFSRQGSGLIQWKGLPPGAQVQLYTMAGKLLHHTATEGAHVPGSGVYVVVYRAGETSGFAKVLVW